MSSDGSVSSTSSRIRQFGLYRTIDAKTEEFLRLSRKRQIKQGCACAAISTAVTVIIVISIILVYEYSILPGSISKTTSKPNWLGLMNSSADTVFDPKLNNPKIKFDQSSIQLLPLLVRTLKQSAFYDKPSDDASSGSSVEMKESTESSIKNTNSDARNWMRIPISRMYAIEYKTSPVVYLSPTRQNDYFTKVRKIREYKRMLNYVDKMINEKVTFGSTQPMLREGYGIYLNKDTFTTPMTPITNTEVDTKTHRDTGETKMKQTCICPKKMGQLIRKIIESFQVLLPEHINENVYLIPCKTNDPSVKTPTVVVTEASSYQPNTSTIKTKIYNTKQNLITSTTSSLALKSSMPHRVSKQTINREFNKIMNLLRPTEIKLDWDIHKRSYYKTNKSLIRPIIDDSNRGNFAAVISLSSTENYVKSEADYIYIRPKLNKTSNNDRSTFPVFTEDDYEEEMVTTPMLDTIHKFHFPDSPILKILKKNNFPLQYNKIKTENTNKFGYSKLETRNESQNNSKTSIKNNTNLLPEIRNLSTSTFKPTTTFNIEINITTPSTQYFYKVDQTKLDQKQNDVMDTNNIKVNKKVFDKHLKLYKTDQLGDITMEEEFEKALTENPEFHLKNMESIVNFFNSSKNFPKILSNESFYIPQTDLKNLSQNNSKSMIPRSRPSYLEIQRGDWKRDEVQDYENANNYIFE